MRYALFAFVFPVASAWAQPAEVDTGRVRGVVRDSLTRAPLEAVAARGDSSAATTDINGRFTIEHLEPGRHWISVYDRAKALRGGVYALVSAGQEVNVEILVKRGGTITGKVVDEDQKPVGGASVLLLEREFEDGHLAYSREKTVTTGATGEYRLEGVWPERGFLILAKKRLAVGSKERKRIPVPTYYPNSTEAQDAQPVTLAPGENREGVNLKMASADSYCIGGSLSASGGDRPASLTIT